MLQLLYRNYHISNQDKIKKAVIISFSEQITESNYKEHSKELKEVLIKEYDSYVFHIQDPEIFFAYTLKLMIAFSNSCSGKIGLLIKDNNQEIYTALHLDSYFVVNSDIKAIITFLEKTGGK